MNNESVIHFNPSISVKVKKIIRQPEAQFRNATCDTELLPVTLNCKMGKHGTQVLRTPVI